jgi:hypothetical protein
VLIDYTCQDKTLFREFKDELGGIRWFLDSLFQKTPIITPRNKTFSQSEAVEDIEVGV